MVRTKGPAGDVEYLTHPSKTVVLRNARGKMVKRPIKPSIEIRLPHGEGKRTFFYLDRVFVIDSTLIGNCSRFLGSLRRIPLDEIRRIEV